jgi:hypothetical protein
MNSWASSISKQIDSLNEAITERRALDEGVFTGERGNDARSKRYAYRFDRTRERGLHALVSGGIRGQAFLRILGKIALDNEILNCIPVKTQRNMSIEHANARMRFYNANV